VGPLCIIYCIYTQIYIYIHTHTESSFYLPLWWCSITMRDKIWSWRFHKNAFYFVLYFINRFLLLQAMPSTTLTSSASLFLFYTHTHTQSFVGSLAALTFSDLLATPAAGISQVKGCMARPTQLCSVEGLNSTGFCVWLFLLVIYKLCQPAVHSRPSRTELCRNDVSCFCAWHGSSGDTSGETHFYSWKWIIKGLSQ